ncbi:AAA family ATPase [Miltoncostaea oceani]|uniref:AAA family ATPase n=1 Tax=Miltoncostaea oceani TaxID=2843216 RepID=UPI001C3E4E23|nr:AAA family ATPase [Miltoncostaea oceani]
MSPPETDSPDIDEPVREGGLDSQAMARPGCPACKGKGTVERPREDGSIDYRVCLCVLHTQRRATARLMIARRFDPLMRRMTFAAYDPGSAPENLMALRVARNFCDSWVQARREGWVLGLWGTPGCGKTHLATAMALELTRRFLAKSLVVTVPNLLRDQRRTFGASERSDVASPIERAINADFLVLDDLGAEYLRSREGARSEVDWVSEQLYLLLDERLRHDRPTVFTTNYSPTDLQRVLQERVSSRLERAEVMPALEMTKVSARVRTNAGAQNLLTKDRPSS